MNMSIDQPDARKNSSKSEQDIINPPHYMIEKIECIDVIELLELGFNLGNTLKYIWRAGKKDSALIDLKKAKWYLEREIAKFEKLQSW
jgi:hypothetical protein